MINEDLRRELLSMRAEDLTVREELIQAGELEGHHYVPRMEAVHVRNANRLRELIAKQGWPSEDVAGEDGAEAAWLIVQHAIGEPKFQRESLKCLQTCALEGRAPLWQAAYLEDRIAMLEGRPQCYGTQWLDDPVDGRNRPWTLAEPDQVNAFRQAVGLDPLAPIPERGPELAPEQQRAIEENHQWWRQWLAKRDG